MTDRIVTLYQEGHTLEEVAASVGISKSKVWYHLRNKGVKTRGVGPERQFADRDAAIVADRNAGMKFRELAVKYDTAVSNVARIVYRARKEQRRERAA